MHLGLFYINEKKLSLFFCVHVGLEETSDQSQRQSGSKAVMICAIRTPVMKKTEVLIISLIHFLFDFTRIPLKMQMSARSTERLTDGRSDFSTP